MQEPVVAASIEEGLRADHVRQLFEVGALHLLSRREHVIAAACDASGVEFADRERGIAVAQHSSLVPLQLDPRRIAQDQVKATSRRKDLGKAQFPMVEAQPFGHAHRRLEHRLCVNDLVHIGGAKGLLALPSALLKGLRHLAQARESAGIRRFGRRCAVFDRCLQPELPLDRRCAAAKRQLSVDDLGVDLA